MSTLNIPLSDSYRKYFFKSLPFASWPSTMINSQWLELLMSRTSFHGPKDVPAIKIELYILSFILQQHMERLKLEVALKHG